jgi:triacylglycerol lipase
MKERRTLHQGSGSVTAWFSVSGEQVGRSVKKSSVSGIDLLPNPLYDFNRINCNLTTIRSQEAMNQTPISFHSLAIGDKSLSYFSVGTGRTVVIVHGVGGHKEDWIEVASALANKRRVIGIDMLGFGESSKNGDDLSMPVQAAAIRALLEHHNVERADLVGNSVGGWVAATFAAQYPDRLNRLLLVDPAGFKAMFEGTPPVNFDPNNPDEMEAVIEITINSAAANKDGLARKAFEAYVKSGEKAISGTWSRSLFTSTRLEELFPKITTPTLVLWGAEDKLFPSVLAEVFSAQISGSNKLLIPDAGHFPHIDNPQATIKALSDYLSTEGH